MINKEKMSKVLCIFLISGLIFMYCGNTRQENVETTEKNQKNVETSDEQAADIEIENAVLTATSSEAVCVEGLNSHSLADCELSGDMQD